MSYFKNILNATSQWFNALSGGNPDVPISARVGYYSYEGLLWFRVIEWFIDVAFFPIDGVDHCYLAWKSDTTEKVMKGSVYSIGVMSLFALSGSLLIAPFSWGVYGLTLLAGIKK